MKTYKHYHGTPNQVMSQEEASILLCVERALASSSNSQTIGKNGEQPFIEFLQRYLPNTLRATSGHFVTPSGDISPQLDAIVFDSRYPLLSENIDGSALLMLNSVVHIYELKTNLTTKDIRKSVANSQKVAALTQQIKDFDTPDGWGAPRQTLLGYRTEQRLETLEAAFFNASTPEKAQMDCIILRCNPRDAEAMGGVGGTLHLEPPFPEESGRGPRLDGYFPMFIPSHTPLSDLYYTLVQDAYYTLGERNYSFHDIGAHFNDYMSWATA
ncbi:DUF6602 domain-containing protein [Ideonella paludis]|uniref:DUF6602 domain-containing protein n=1 Tax=Ideonella paludis TaxID=1233411 RepID=A0ABS5DTK3_9BURK|nr:DUF6602 domain-containing protein [Ideonella paludis]MBQ0934466.1 hypothetical protein [Ideonella paludis]